MADFERAHAFIYPSEKGLSNSASDRGGETNHGISQKAFPNLDIKNLSYESAKKLAFECYWKRYRINEITSQPIATFIYDMIFNMDYDDAVKAIQRAVGGIKVDGVMGSVTIAAINSCQNLDWLLDRIFKERMRVYLLILDRLPNQAVNMRSWMRRSLRDYKTV